MRNTKELLLDLALLAIATIACAVFLYYCLPVAVVAVHAQSGNQDTVTAATVTTSSTQMLAAGRRSYVAIQNVGSSNAIACNFGGTAALNTAGSFQIAAGVQLKWGEGTSSETAVLFTPTLSQAINCIAASSSTPATIESH